MSSEHPNVVSLFRKAEIAERAVMWIDKELSTNRKITVNVQRKMIDQLGKTPAEKEFLNYVLSTENSRIEDEIKRNNDPLFGIF